VIVGVPLTGVGITATHLEPSWRFVEVAAVWTLANATLLVAWEYLRLGAVGEAPIGSRRLWSVAAASLVIGMALAVVYGSRYLTPAVLDIPTMRAVHGTLQAFGFAACVLTGCQIAERAPMPLGTRCERAIIGPSSHRSDLSVHST